jgi:hypothetical protein
MTARAVQIGHRRSAKAEYRDQVIVSKRAIRNFAAAALLVTLGFPVEAHQAKKVPRVGILLPWSSASGVSLSFREAFRAGLHELGYVEGQNFAIEHRYAEGVSERFPNRCGGAGPSKGGHHRDDCRATISCCKVSNQHHSHCLYSGYRPCCGRACRQPCPTRGEYHGLVPSRSGASWKTVGTAKGIVPQDLPRRCPTDITFSILHCPVQRNAGCGQGDGCSASIAGGAKL